MRDTLKEPGYFYTRLTALRIPIFFTYWQPVMAQINFLASLNTLQIV